MFRKLTVEENIMAVLEVQPISWQERRRKRDQLIDELGLGHIRNNMGYALSGGERRRVEIARALCIAPKFILLDEPFSGIDPIAVLDLQKIIFDLKGSGIGVLITDHNVRETLSVTDRAYIINEGRIFRTGTPEQLGNDPEVKRVYLGESFFVLHLVRSVRYTRASTDASSKALDPGQHVNYEVLFMYRIYVKIRLNRTNGFTPEQTEFRVSQKQILTPGLVQMVSVLALNKLELRR